jgi:ribosomal protein S18 acetylase RimI-like enzyme
MKHSIVALRAQPDAFSHRLGWHEKQGLADFSRFPIKVPPELDRNDSAAERPVPASRIHRKLALLQRTGLFAESTPGVVVERARTADEFQAAYRLVHDIYVERGYCREEDWGMRLRVFEATSHMATFIARTADGSVVGVLSVVGDCGRAGLPSEAAFPEEIARIRAAGVRLCEVTNQAIDPRFRKSSLPTELMRCAMAHGITMGYQRAIATVSPSHTGFYNLLNFFPIGPVRSYSSTIDDPVVALCGDLDLYRGAPSEADEVSAFIHHFMSSGNPFLARVARWESQATATFLEPNLLRRLFMSECSFLDECSDTDFVFIEEQWGWQLFDEVTEPESVEETETWSLRITSCPSDGGHHPLSVCWPTLPDRPGAN